MIINKIKKEDLIDLYNFDKDYLNYEEEKPYLYDNTIFEIQDYKIINIAQSKRQYIDNFIKRLNVVDKQTNLFLNGLQNQLKFNSDFVDNLFYEIQQKQHSIINLEEYKDKYFINLKEGVHFYIGSMSIKKILFILNLQGDIFLSEEEKEIIKERLIKEGF